MRSGFQNQGGRKAPPPLRFRRLIATAIAFVLLAACGPSVQSIYEGNVRFEHCYRLDLEVDTAPTHRRACWSEWLRMYTYGQPRDRIEYARRRLSSFANGDSARPTLDIGATDDHKTAEARQFYLVVPAPTSVHAPPPPIATRWYGDAGTAPPPPTEQVATPTPMAAPADECSNRCRESHANCQRPCAPDAGKPAPACNNCDSDYKACMKRCFQ
ncbi:MAG TPA: hypothetical protein VFK05_01205 [Polyangiaceae bacterium]|nr:hypothetical protein [Polyangiaceae bacterium]